MTVLPAQPHTGGRQAAPRAERTCTLINKSASGGLSAPISSPVHVALDRHAMQMWSVCFKRQHITTKSPYDGFHKHYLQRAASAVNEINTSVHGRVMETHMNE